MNSQVTHYHRAIQVIHWLSALTVIGLFAVGLWMVDLSYYSEWYRTAPHWHKSIGLLLAAVTLLRIILRFVTTSPKVEGNGLEKLAAKFMHLLLYVNLAILFTSGYLISTADGRGIDVFNWFTLPSVGALFNQQSDIAGTVHFYAAWTLIVMAFLHGLAALKHHFINKDNTLRKMIGASK
ncbi:MULTISPECIES: cytochrome b [Vibrio]|uniref:cytochrome b n=1 Tax=Vibrio TaxID=662 RepID=UPI000C1642D4|nr:MULTISPECIES: cytochrome b [Vibrio]NNN45222.1 cytochrome b [Vibrio sp. 1-1(7)]NNN72595.1 cytochrome b [Vibrio sp. 12-2(3-a)]